MAKQSAGILAYRYRKDIEVLLVHPGGPFYKAKDLGVWSIPKGEYTDEEPLATAKREFAEETGNFIDEGDFILLDDIILKSGKKITAFAVETDFKACFISSNTFKIEWPPKSGNMSTFPEVDKAEWFPIHDAKQKIHPAQNYFLDQLESILKNKP